MPQYLPLPDGSSVTVQKGETPQQAWFRAQEMYPDAFGIEEKKEPEKAKPKGFLSGLKTGFESGAGSATAGIGELTGIEKLKAYGEELKKTAAERGEDTSWLGQTGQAIGNVAGRYGAPILAGISAGAAAPEVGLASALGFAAANLPLNVGETLSAQKEAGQERNNIKALAVGIGKTALDSLGGELLAGPMRSVIGKTAMEQASALVPEVLSGKLTAQEASAQVNGFLKNFAQGTAQNAVVGGATMVGHDVLERAGLGQDITSPEALAGYGKELVAGAEVAPVFGAWQARGARKAAQAKIAEAGAQRAEAMAETPIAEPTAPEEHPEYMQKVVNEYENAWKQYQNMNSALGKKPGANDPPHLALEYEENKAAAEAQKKVAEELAPEYHRVQKILKAQQPEPMLALPAPEAKGETPALEGIQTNETKPNVLDLVDQYHREQESIDKVLPQIEEAKAANDRQKVVELGNAIEGAQVRMENLKAKIDDLGGVLETPETIEKNAARELKAHDKKIASATAKFNQASDVNVMDIPAMRQHNATLDKLEKEREDLLAKHEEQRTQIAKQETPKGETLPLFSEKEAPPVVAQKPEEALSFEQPKPEEAPKRNTNQRILFSKKNLENTAERSETAADRIAKTPVGETASLFTTKEAPTIKEPAGPPKPQEVVKETKAERVPDTNTLDLFTPENFAKTEERNLPEKEQAKLISNRLDAHLLERLQLPGTEVTRVASPKETEIVMDRIEELRKKIHEVRGMQKTSRYDVANNLKNEYEALKARADAGEKGQVPNATQKALERYKDYIAKHIAPTHAEIERLHKSLYKVKQVEPPKVEKEKARSKADEESRRVRMSREASTQARINKGDVRKEAEASEHMRKLARELGREEPEYVQYVKEMQRKLKAAIDAGQNKTDVTNMVQKMLVEKAEKIGKTTPEYKRTLKEQTEYFKEALASAGKQELKSKRTTQVTRDVRNAPRELRSASPEAQAQRFAAEDKNVKRQYLKDYAKELAEAAKHDEGMPTTYREEERTPLSEATQETLAQHDLQGVLADLAKTSKSELIRKKAVELAEFVKDTKTRIVSELKHNGESVPALYDSKTDTIKFHPDGMTEEDVIHEITHAATLKQLDRPVSELTPDQRRARKEIEAIYGKLTKEGKLEGEYAAKDIHEFVSEINSNEGLRKLLAKEKWAGSEGRSMLRRLLDATMRLLGLHPKDIVGATEHHLKSMYAPSERYAMQEKASIFRTPKAEYGSDNPLASLSKKVVATAPEFKDKFKGITALAAEMETVDMRAGVRAGLNMGAKAIGKDNLATQAMYHILKADDKVQLAMTTLKIGPLEIYKDAKGYYGIRSSGKNSGMGVFEAISKIPEGNDRAKVDMATSYLIAERANNKGLKKLDLGELGLEQKDLDEALAYVESRPELKKALAEVRKQYNAYNEGQINFLAQTGAITKKMAADLLKEGDYVPFYRVDPNGNATLIFNDNVMVDVGNIKNQPYLHALKGGEAKILPLDQSILQNTLLLTDKATTNLAMKSTAYAFQEIGKVRPNGGKNEMVIHTGTPPAGAKDVIHFNQEPDPSNPKDNGKRWIQIDTKGTLMDSVPTDLVMKSLEGTALTLPAYLKLGGAAADLLRSGVTRTPLYIAHQLLKDPMAATFTGGVDKNPFMAVLGAGKHFIEMQRGTSETGAKLIKAGIIQSGIFKGDKSDIAKFALQLASGKDVSAIDKLIAMTDRAAMSADASTRALVYENAVKKGLSEVEADMATTESMNYQKRGLSATVQHANRLIPFMNSQIQGLNVLAKSVRGNMPFEEQLKIKQKFYNNALLLAGSGLAYGMALSDNEYYKNAKLKDKYNNLFVFLPGVDEPLKMPVPYEVGYFFSLGAAAADAMRDEVKTKDQIKALASVFSNSIPGYSSAGVPQVIKPLAEVALNHDFYTGQAIESQRLQKLDPTERYTAHTTELAKQLSSLVGGAISPIMLEHLTRGYLGQLPLAAAAGANELFATGTGKEISRASDLPLIGSAFQKKFGGEQADEAYNLADDAEKAKATFRNMVKEGRKDEAKEYLEENKDRIKMATSSVHFKQTMSKLYADTRLIESRKDLNPEEKRARLDKLDETRQKVADRYLAVAQR